MTADPRTQMLKGALTLVLLRLLAVEESYGYGLVQRLRAAGFEFVGEGTVYPALARLEREGYVSARLVPSDAGPARKYYRPSEDGYARLSELEASWRDLTGSVDSIPSSMTATTKKELP